VRIRWKAAIVMLVLMGATVGVLMAVFAVEARREYRSEVTEILEKLVPGDADEDEVRRRAIAVWEESSHLLREAMLRDRFVDMVDRLNRTMGSFRSILKVVRVEEGRSVLGRTVRVDLELEFERAKTTGEVSLHRGAEPEWRLLGLRVAIPEPLRAKADALEVQYERVRAPDEVLDLTFAILERIRDGHGRSVYEEASDQFRESVTSAERFEELLASQKQALGDFKRVLAVISSAQKSDRSRARVFVLLEFEEEKTTGTFEFIKAPEDPRGDAWLLAFYKIIIPQPLLPTRD
jgi:hypothetical protein